MTDSWIRGTFPLHRICFGFLPYPDLFQWNFKEKKIVRNKHTWAILPWFTVNIVLTSLIAIFAPLYFLYSDISAVTRRYSDKQLVCHWIILMGGWMTVTLAIIQLFARQEMMESCNALHNFQDRYTSPPGNLNHGERFQSNWKDDIIGYMCCQTVLTMALGGPFLIAFGVFDDVDPLGFLFELWLPHPTNRSWFEVLGGICIRLTLQGITMSDSLRVLSWGIINTALLVCVCTKTLKTLLLIPEYSRWRDIREKFKIYDELIILSNVLLPSGKLIIVDLFFTGLLAGVILIWPLFKVESIRNTLLFWLIVLVAFGIFLFMWVMIPCAAIANDLASKLLKTWSIDCEKWCNVNRKYVRRWVRARRVLSATCYDFFSIDGTTFPKYLNIILDNIINALLLW